MQRQPRLGNEESAKILANELQKLGIDISTEEGRADFRQNMLWARNTRKRCEKSGTYFILVLIGGTVSAAIGFAIDFFTTLFK